MGTQARLEGNLTIFPNQKCTYACIRIVIAALFITAPIGHYPDGHQQNEPVHCICYSNKNKCISPGCNYMTDPKENVLYNYLCTSFNTSERNVVS